MKRDIIKMAEQGKKHMTATRDLRADELQLLYNLSVFDRYEAIATAFHLGYELGLREMKTKQKKEIENNGKEEL